MTSCMVANPCTSFSSSIIAYYTCYILSQHPIQFFDNESCNSMDMMRSGYEQHKQLSLIDVNEVRKV